MPNSTRRRSALPIAAEVVLLEQRALLSAHSLLAESAAVETKGVKAEKATATISPTQITGIFDFKRNGNSDGALSVTLEGRKLHVNYANANDIVGGATAKLRNDVLTFRIKTYWPRGSNTLFTDVTFKLNVRDDNNMDGTARIKNYGGGRPPLINDVTMIGVRR